LPLPPPAIDAYAAAIISAADAAMPLFFYAADCYADAAATRADGYGY